MDSSPQTMTVTDSRSRISDQRAGDLLSEVMRRLGVVRSEGDPQPAACAELCRQKPIGIMCSFPICGEF